MEFQNISFVINEMGYDALNGEIKRTMRRSAKDLIKLGYMLKIMFEKRVWEGHYLSFDKYLEIELKINYKTARRFIQANEKYSMSGNGMEIMEKYKDYSQSVLIEMLNIPQELEDRITPDMTAREVRAVKNQEKQKKEIEKTSGEDPDRESAVIDGKYRKIDTSGPETVGTGEVATSRLAESAYGLKKTEYPEGSMLSCAGCGNKYDCFSCAQNCNIRQEKRYCVFATLGNPFDCEIMEILENGVLEKEVGERCQFVNNKLAGCVETGEAVPCCRDCEEICKYGCFQKNAAGQPETDRLAENDNITDDLSKIRSILDQEKKLLHDFIELGEQPEDVVFRQKTIVGALAALICDLEDVKQEGRQKEQPELPFMPNNKKREEFIDSYGQWPVWIDIKETGERYYRYQFQDGTSFIVKVYLQKRFDYGSNVEKWEDKFRDEWGSEEYYILEEGNYFKDCETRKIRMVDFLKTIQEKDSMSHER